MVSNGQALCRNHNRRKSNLRPPWWYVVSLENRRAAYVGPGVESRVLGRMNTTGVLPGPRGGTAAVDDLSVGRGSARGG